MDKRKLGVVALFVAGLIVTGLAWRLHERQVDNRGFDSKMAALVCWSKNRELVEQKEVSETELRRQCSKIYPLKPFNPRPYLLAGGIGISMVLCAFLAAILFRR